MRDSSLKLLRRNSFASLVTSVYLPSFLLLPTPFSSLSSSYSLFLSLFTPFLPSVQISTHSTIFQAFKSSLIPPSTERLDLPPTFLLSISTEISITKCNTTKGLPPHQKRIETNLTPRSLLNVSCGFENSLTSVNKIHREREGERKLKGWRETGKGEMPK